MEAANDLNLHGLKQPLTRRQMITRMGAGFGGMAMHGLLSTERGLSASSSAKPSMTLPHFKPRAKSVIFLYMTGGPSQIDTFDPKPKLKKLDGVHPSYKSNERKFKGLGFKPSPFKFARYGESGLDVSELFPHVATCADDLCVIRSMKTDIPNHEPGNFMMNLGANLPNRPSMGSWISYGLGSPNQNLPGFVVLAPAMPTCGKGLWNNSFLPGTHQGVQLDTSNMQLDHMIQNIRNSSLTNREQRKQIDLVQQLNLLHLKKRQQDAALESRIQAMELAYKMQFEAADAFDISKESKSIHEMYGGSEFAHACLLARRLVERGVRYVQVYYTQSSKARLLGESTYQPWDSHSDHNGKHKRLALDSDRPVAMLLKDLKQRGLLDETLVLWGGEFGRTPFAEKPVEENKSKPYGRDHHHLAFSMWLAGGGVRGGMTYGKTDDVCMSVVENKVHVHDLHATIFHLLGIDHIRLTYHYSGRDYRLTDVYGRVIEEILL